VNVLNVKLPEYACAQSASYEMQKLYKVDTYYKNARELSYYNIVIVIIDVLLRVLVRIPTRWVHTIMMMIIVHEPMPTGQRIL